MIFGMCKALGETTDLEAGRDVTRVVTVLGRRQKPEKTCVRVQGEGRVKIANR